MSILALISPRARSRVALPLGLGAGKVTKAAQKSAVADAGRHSPAKVLSCLSVVKLASRHR